MKFIICAVLVLSLVSISLGATASGSYKNPEHPGKCYISADLILPPGESKDPNQDCGRIVCTSDGQAQFHTCGPVSLQGFKSAGYEDKSLPYPECCKLKFVPE